MKYRTDIYLKNGQEIKIFPNGVATAKTISISFLGKAR